MYNQEDPNQFSPDGLTEDVIDVLIAEVAEELKISPVLLGGTDNVQRRDRRTVRRTLSGTVRVLRIHGQASASTGTEAA